MVWPVFKFVMPDVFHLTSLSPRISILYLSISFVTCAHLPLWYSVLTFHVPILVVSLVENSSIGLRVICCFRLKTCSSSSLWRERVLAIVVVSVINTVFQGRVINPTLNPLCPEDRQLFCRGFHPLDDCCCYRVSSTRIFCLDLLPFPLIQESNHKAVILFDPYLGQGWWVLGRVHTPVGLHTASLGPLLLRDPHH